EASMGSRAAKGGRIIAGRRYGPHGRQNSRCLGIRALGQVGATDSHSAGSCSDLHRWGGRRFSPSKRIPPEGDRRRLVWAEVILYGGAFIGSHGWGLRYAEVGERASIGKKHRQTPEQARRFRNERRGGATC